MTQKTSPRAIHKVRAMAERDAGRPLVDSDIRIVSYTGMYWTEDGKQGAGAYYAAFFYYEGHGWLASGTYKEISDSEYADYKTWVKTVEDRRVEFVPPLSYSY